MGYWTYNTEFNVYEKVRGHRIRITGFEMLDLFCHSYISNGGFRCIGISEGRTGGIIGRGKTLADAKKEAEIRLRKWNKYASIAAIQDYAQMVALRCGKSPRYKELDTTISLRQEQGGDKRPLLRLVHRIQAVEVIPYHPRFHPHPPGFPSEIHVHPADE